MTNGREASTGLSLDQFIRFRDYIYAKSGLHFAESKKYLLDSRLASRVAAVGLRGPDEYYLFLRYDPKGPEEMGRLFEAVTNNETSFFRTNQQFDLFREELAPKALEARKSAGSPHLRVWSAGCSTGEEAYSLALILREKLGPNLGGQDVKILAHDISARALDVAKAGVFSEPALRNIPPELRTRYFSPQAGGTWVLDPKVRAMVDFSCLNLSDIPPEKCPKDVDVVFCRNVLIYFDMVSKKKVLNQIYDSLRDGGYLMVGASESLHGITRAFNMIVRTHAVVYQKEERR